MQVELNLQKVFLQSGDNQLRYHQLYSYCQNFSKQKNLSSFKLFIIYLDEKCFDTFSKSVSFIIFCLNNNYKVLLLSPYEKKSTTDICLDLNVSPNDTYVFKHRDYDYPKAVQVNIFKLKENSYPALIIKTGGTTSDEKYVQLSLSNLINSASNTLNFYKLKSNIIWLMTLPSYHIGGLMILVRSFINHSTIDICSYKNIPWDNFSDKNELIISLVPTQLKYFYENDLIPIIKDKIKLIILSGAKISSDLKNNIIHSKLPVSFSYGATETCSQVHASLPNDFYKTYNLGNTELRNDDSGALIISGSTIAHSIIENKTPSLLNSIFHSDDIAIYKDQQLQFKLRRDNTIISGGFNISKNKVELALNNVADIDYFYLKAYPHSKWGEVFYCYLYALKDLKTIDIKNSLSTHLQKYEIPYKFFVLRERPNFKNPNPSEISQSLELKDV